jgi:hypothetical protein
MNKNMSLRSFVIPIYCGSGSAETKSYGSLTQFARLVDLGGGGLSVVGVEFATFSTLFRASCYSVCVQHMFQFFFLTYM